MPKVISSRCQFSISVILSVLCHSLVLCPAHSECVDQLVSAAVCHTRPHDSWLCGENKQTEQDWGQLQNRQLHIRGHIQFCLQLYQEQCHLTRVKAKIFNVSHRERNHCITKDFREPKGFPVLLNFFKSLLLKKVPRRVLNSKRGGEKDEFQ